MSVCSFRCGKEKHVPKREERGGRVVSCCLGRVAAFAEAEKWSCVCVRSGVFLFSTKFFYMGRKYSNLVHTAHEWEKVENEEGAQVLKKIKRFVQQQKCAKEIEPSE